MSYLDSFFLDIAHAIRVKSGTSEKIQAINFPDKIIEIPNGKLDIDYKEIIYNTDNTITFIDKNDVEHLMKCVFDASGKLKTVKMDGIVFFVTYEGDYLVSINNTKIDLKNKIYLDTAEALIGDVTSIQEELEIASKIIGGEIK
jgi:hypothetical protein